MRHLSAEEILILHALVVDETGGSHGVRDAHLLASIAHKPQSAFGGKELYRGVFKKVAVLMEAIVNYHVFLDGNKRTAFTAAARFLYVNGYKFVPGTKEAERTVIAIATKDIDIEMIAEWLKKNSKKVSR